MGSKKITFRIQMDDCLIIGNPDLLKQVWMNLIDNAIKFSFPEGEICIHAAETHNGFLFRIRDNGIGMSSLTQEKIFNRFYQGDPSHSVEGNGWDCLLSEEFWSFTGEQSGLGASREKGVSFL